MSISDALGYKHVNLWLEQYEDNLDENAARVSLRDESAGFGKRFAANKVRPLVLNLSTEFSGDIVLDFRGIDLISASYADELVVKLLRNPGVGERLRLANLSDACSAVIGELSIERLVFWKSRRAF